MNHFKFLLMWTLFFLYPIQMFSMSDIGAGVGDGADHVAVDVLEEQLSDLDISGGAEEEPFPFLNSARSRYDQLNKERSLPVSYFDLLPNEILIKIIDSLFSGRYETADEFLSQLERLIKVDSKLSYVVLDHYVLKKVFRHYQERFGCEQLLKLLKKLNNENRERRIFCFWDDDTEKRVRLRKNLITILKENIIGFFENEDDRRAVAFVDNIIRMRRLSDLELLLDVGVDVRRAVTGNDVLHSFLVNTDGFDHSLIRIMLGLETINDRSNPSSGFYLSIFSVVLGMSVYSFVFTIIDRDSSDRYFVLLLSSSVLVLVMYITYLMIRSHLYVRRLRRYRRLSLARIPSEISEEDFV